MMRCHVCLPDDHVLEIEVDQKASGQTCLDKVCERLGVLEDDYLGLQYRGSKHEVLWLNLRNRLDHQVSGHQPYRFNLRVKFCVQPHHIQQDTTRHIFSLQIWNDLKSGKLQWDGSDGQLAKMVALVAKAKYGDQTSNSHQRIDYVQILQVFRPALQLNENLIDAVAQEHAALHGVPMHSAEYRLLQEVSTLPTFGIEFHEVRSAHGDKILFGVGPEGLLLRNVTAGTEENLSYPSIHMATHREREVYLQLIDDAGELLPAVGYKLVSRKAAVALYRCITEMHSFYRCDTVSCDVSNQFCRDLKGTLVSIFNENSDLGKRFIFDIKRTSREAYDHARRKLYSLSQSTQSLTAAGLHHGSTQSMDVDRDNSSCDSDQCSSIECQRLKERLEMLEDSFVCCVCMSRLVSTVLCPCGHLTCSSCAPKIMECPLCRREIERRQKVFLPGFHAQKDEVSRGGTETEDEEDPCPEVV